MNDHQFIGYTLLNASAISSLVSTRVYHGMRPKVSQISELPAIDYYQLSGGRKYMGTVSRTFTINCRATSPAVARQLGDAVIDLFGGTSGTGVYGYSSSFSVARASIARDNGTIVDDDSETVFVPIDVLVVYTTDTVS